MSTQMTSLDAIHRFLLHRGYFLKLDDSQFQKLLECSQVLELKAGTVLAWQDEVPQGAWVVLDGCLVHQVLEGQSLLDPQYIGIGEGVSGAASLLPIAMKGTLRSKIDTKVWFLDRSRFTKLLKSDVFLLRRVKNSFSKINENPSSGFLSPSVLSAYKDDERGGGDYTEDIFSDGDERRLLVKRTSGKLLGFSSVFPLVLVFLSLSAGWALYQQWGEKVSPLFLWLLPGILTLVGLMWFLGQFLLWWGHTLILTDRSVIYQRVDIFKRTSQYTKIPWGRVQSFTVDKKGFRDHLLGLHRLSITSHAQGGGITVSHIQWEKTSAEMMSTLQNSCKGSESFSPLRHLRQVLEKQLGVAQESKVLVSFFVEENHDTQSSKKRKLVWQGSDGTLIFRKHPWTLFREVWIPLGGGLVSAVGIILAQVNLDFPLALGFSLFLSLIVFVLGFRVWYLIEDWTNDLYQIAGTQVVSHHKKPLWGNSNRKEVQLDNVQEVLTEKKGLWPMLLDYGKVKIRTGGGDTLVFEDLPHPERIQNRVFELMEKVLQNKKRKEKQESQEEMAVLLDLYHQMVEQEMVPRRSPE